MKLSLNKKWIYIGLAVVLLSGSGYWAYNKFKTVPTTATPVTAKAQKGDVRKAITATGIVDYATFSDLSFDQSSNQISKVTELNVKIGDKVKLGQVLAKIDTAAIETALQQAQVSLASAQLRYNQALESSDSSVLNAFASAQKNVNDRLQALNTARQNADSAYLANQMAIAQQNLANASNNLARAQQLGDTAGIQSAQTSLANALNTLASAEAAQNGGAAQALVAAEAFYKSSLADLEMAKSNLKKKQSGMATSEILSAQSSLTQAQVNLKTAQDNLQKATINAPFDGVVTNVSFQLYQNADNKSVISVAAGENMYIVDAVIDQADISKVKIGQKANITLDTYPDKHAIGTVSQIALKGTTTQNVTTFKVQIKLDEPNEILHAGMNANVSIILEEAKNVLTVPSEAIRSVGQRKMIMVPGKASEGTQPGKSQGKQQQGQTEDTQGTQGSQQGQGQRPQGQGGQAQGQRSQGGQRAQGSSSFAIPEGVEAHYIPVETGIDDGSLVEIKSGLNEGDTIIVSIRTTSATGTSGSTGTNTNRSTNPLGGNPMGQLNRATGGR